MNSELGKVGNAGVRTGSYPREGPRVGAMSQAIVGHAYLYYTRDGMDGLTMGPARRSRFPLIICNALIYNR